MIEQGFAEVFAGFLGMVIAVLATSSFVPSMLQKGTLDLVLARPIGRVRLLLAKYLGGLWFIAILATFLVTGCWAGISIRTGYSSPWFLFSIVTVILVFAVLHSVSVLVGVWLRSAVLASLAAFGIWGMSGIIVNIRHSMKMFFFGADVPPAIVQAFEIAYAILPKTKDISLLSTYALSRSYLSPAAFKNIFAHQLPPVDWAFSLGTTAAFAVVTLALAAWIFRRRDY